MVTGPERQTKDVGIKNQYPLKINKHILAIVCTIAIHFTTAAQWKAGIEQYFYTHTTLSEAFVPMVHLQSPDNFYAELRYNYEEAKTISFFAGKAFPGGNAFEYKITPMAGYSTGRFTGLSLAINTDAEWKNIFFSSQTQYSMSVRKKDTLALKNNTDNFFYSWSEMGYNLTDHFFAGLSMQYTRQTGESDFEPGFLAGLSFKDLSFPFYVFSPFRSDRYFIIGVNYEFSLKKKK